MILPVVTAITLVLAAAGAVLPRPSARRLRWLLPPTFVAGAALEPGLWQRVALLTMALVVVTLLLNARHDRRRHPPPAYAGYDGRAPRTRPPGRRPSRVYLSSNG